MSCPAIVTQTVTLPPNRRKHITRVGGVRTPLKPLKNIHCDADKKKHEADDCGDVPEADRKGFKFGHGRSHCTAKKPSTDRPPDNFTEAGIDSASANVVALSDAQCGMCVGAHGRHWGGHRNDSLGVALRT